MKSFSSPLLNDSMSLLKVLYVVSKHHILLYSEGLALYPLRDEGWLEYHDGRWHITEAGSAQLVGVEEPEEDQSLNAFFGVE